MTLKDFIAEELKRRNLTIREFAKEVGVSSSTIVRTMSKKPPEPSLEFLAKLARYTHTDLCSLVALIHPDATTVNAEAAIIANRVAQLPPERQEMFDEFILWLSSQKSGDSSKKNR